MPTDTPNEVDGPARRPPSGRHLGSRAIDRTLDRWVVLAAVVASIAFLAAAVLALLLPTSVRRGLWLPLHLALAGGATTAIVGVMPFFVAAFATAPPAGTGVRAVSVAAVALGAVAVTLGVAGSASTLAVLGGVGFVSGIVLAGIATVRPLVGALGPSRGLVTRAYVAALAMVGLGATIATLSLAGWAPIVAAWPQARVAHAWLNLFGFVSLVIVATLLHLFPTVLGARITRHPSATVAVGGVGSSAPLVALGYWIESDWLVRVGALAALTGSLALAVYATRIWRARARWSSDPGWHRFVIGGLASTIVWFVVGVVVAAGRAISSGAAIEGWSLDLVAGPLVLGWVGLSIVASASHLLPAIGPGDPSSRARQRRILGVASAGRLAALDAGIAGVAVGESLRIPVLTALGGVLVGIGFTASAALIGAAVVAGFRSRSSSRESSS
ncbi:MAG TPA: hypothetical protein VNJ28_08755 [Candidatus Limnocylindrales bacterium]|nr:hypothetical protein [Candidatus Limnocylindrales bacterium]